MRFVSLATAVNVNGTSSGPDIKAEKENNAP